MSMGRRNSQSISELQSIRMQVQLSGISTALHLQPAELQSLSGRMQGIDAAKHRVPIFDSRDPKTNPHSKPLRTQESAGRYFSPARSGESAFASFRRQLREPKQCETVVAEFLRKNLPPNANPVNAAIAAHRARLQIAQKPEATLPRGSVQVNEIHGVLEAFEVQKLISFYTGTLQREFNALDEPLTRLEAEKDAALKLPVGDLKDQTLSALHVKFETFHAEHLKETFAVVMDLERKSQELLQKLGGLKFDEFTPDLQVTVNQFADLMLSMKQMVGKNFGANNEVALLLECIADNATRAYVETALVRLRTHVSDAGELEGLLAEPDRFKDFLRKSQEHLDLPEATLSAIALVPPHVNVLDGVSPSLLPRIEELFGDGVASTGVAAGQAASTPNPVSSKPVAVAFKLPESGFSAIEGNLVASSREALASTGRKELDGAYGQAKGVDKIISAHAASLTDPSQVPPPLDRGAVPLAKFNSALEKFDEHALEGLTGKTLDEFAVSLEAHDKLTGRREALEREFEREAGRWPDIQARARERSPRLTQALADYERDRSAFYAKHMKGAMPELFALEDSTRQMVHMVGGLPLDEIGPDLQSKVRDWALSVEATKLAVGNRFPLKHPAYKLLECASDNAEQVLAQVSLIAGRAGLEDEAALQKFLKDSKASVQIMPTLVEFFGQPEGG